MTCNQLGGACDETFTAATFDEIATLSKQHGMQQMQQKDPAHLEAMTGMQRLMQKPDAMASWFENKRDQFNALPEND